MINKKSLATLFLASTLFGGSITLAPSLAHAKNNKQQNNYGQNHAPHYTTDNDYQPNKLKQGRLSQQQTVLVFDSVFSGSNNYGIPEYALIRQQQLPKGIAMNIRRGKSLPVGIANHIYYLPRSSYNALGVNPNYRAGLIGDTLVLLNAAGIVVDLLNNVL